ncbi:hypothetical protein [Streptomyces turgidiscabies]|uniref:Uncharacterized protein n=1 Tax=Streptomyces turgidiscabies TaxID=85558 RepID=A0ABU0RN63_9ACTN|nr:hypothetical protein [Streptomyces turgidiscabies]MDQ0933410.1 hypothetical protein [Streptomyces turgidiscabies]
MPRAPCPHRTSAARTLPDASRARPRTSPCRTAAGYATCRAVPVPAAQPSSAVVVPA